MKKVFVKSFLLLGLGLSLSASAFAQAEAKVKAVSAGTLPATPATAITSSTSPMDLAKAALAAQGGDKFKGLKNAILRGSVDLYAPNSTQSIPGAFVMVIAGEKLRSEIDARPAISFKQIYDGQQSYSSLPGVDLPPLSKLGLDLLTKLDQSGYAVAAIPDKKKLRGFRMSDAAGNVSDFYVDTTTGRVMSISIPYNGYTFATEYKKFKDFDGVLVAVSFTQRLEMPQGAFFADYSVKDVKLNNPLGDDVFTIPN